jgi:hypothetical protein
MEMGSRGRELAILHLKRLRSPAKQQKQLHEIPKCTL